MLLKFNGSLNRVGIQRNGQLYLIDDNFSHKLDAMTHGLRGVTTKMVPTHTFIKFAGNNGNVGFKSAVDAPITIINWLVKTKCSIFFLRRDINYAKL